MDKKIERRKAEVLEDLQKLAEDVEYLHMTVPFLLAELKKIETDAQAIAWQKECDKMTEMLEIISL